MKLRTLTAGVAATTIALAGLTAPQALAAEPGTEPVTEDELNQGLEEISFESSEGTEFLPGETLTLRITHEKDAQPTWVQVVTPNGVSSSAYIR